jgi:hypothetical protein
VAVVEHAVGVPVLLDLQEPWVAVAPVPGERCEYFFILFLKKKILTFLHKCLHTLAGFDYTKIYTKKNAAIAYIPTIQWSRCICNNY